MSNNPKKILIMGLPGAGKTTLASKLVPLLNAVWLNADEVRKKYKPNAKGEKILFDLTMILIKITIRYRNT